LVHAIRSNSKLSRVVINEAVPDAVCFTLNYKPFRIPKQLARPVEV